MRNIHVANGAGGQPSRWQTIRASSLKTSPGQAGHINFVIKTKISALAMITQRRQTCESCGFRLIGAFYASVSIQKILKEVCSLNWKEPVSLMHAVKWLQAESTIYTLSFRYGSLYIGVKLHCLPCAQHCTVFVLTHCAYSLHDAQTSGMSSLPFYGLIDENHMCLYSLPTYKPTVLVSKFGEKFSAYMHTVYIIYDATFCVQAFTE